MERYELPFRVARTLTCVSFLALSAGASACTALLGGDSDDDGPGGTGQTDDEQASEAATEAIAQDIAETDAVLQAADPELFDLAKKYFPSDDPGGPTERLYRLTRRQLDVTAQHVLPGAVTTSAEDTLPPDPLIRNYELSNDLGFNSANFTPYVTWVESTVDNIRSAPELVIDCASASDAASCAAAAVRGFVNASFRGVLSAAEVERYVDFYEASVAEVGEEQAAADLVDITLSSPHFSFREEVFTDPSDRLLQTQALQNISYTLADVPPTALGLNPAEASAYVGTPEAIAETVQAILATEEARAKLLRFFVAWLEISDADDFDIAESAFPEFTPEVASAMVEETSRFLEHQLASAAPVLRGITDSNQSFVTAALADIYGVEGGSGDVLVDLDPEQRRGIFTHPAFIASHSGPVETRLVKRGAYFTRKVMCQELGEPPPDAIPTGPLPGNTERERIENVTEPAGCAGCHSYINPFGFMLENYDAIGRWRVEDEHGYPINSLIEADFLDEGPLVANAPVQGLQGFTESAMFRQCFVQQLFKFYTARPLSDSDDPTLREMFFRFSEDDNQEILTALTILANSSNFNRRLEAK